MCEACFERLKLLSQPGLSFLGLGMGNSLSLEGGPALFELALETFTAGSDLSEAPLQIGNEVRPYPRVRGMLRPTFTALHNPSFERASQVLDCGITGPRHAVVAAGVQFWLRACRSRPPTGVDGSESAEGSLVAHARVRSRCSSSRRARIAAKSSAARARGGNTAQLEGSDKNFPEPASTGRV